MNRTSNNKLKTSKREPEETESLAAQTRNIIVIAPFKENRRIREMSSNGS